MHLSMEPSSQHDWSRWYWRVVLAGVVIGMSFGTWGYLIYEGENASFSTALYHAVQLFAIHMPLLEKPINLPLDIGRWAAAISSGLAVLLLLSRAFLTEWRLFHMHWAENHVVVCGLGEVGTRLALEFRRAGRKVVAIERGVTAPGVAEVESQGIPVIIGDAKAPETLRRVRAHHAMNLLAVCSDDDTNIAITVAVRDIAAAEKSAPANAECLLLLADSDLHEKVAPHLTSAGGDGEFRIKVGGFDMPEMVARLAFEEHPLDFDGIREQDSSRAHLVVVGTCRLGEALAVKALQLCHFANRSRPRVTIVGNDAQGFINRLRQRHPYGGWYLFSWDNIPGNDNWRLIEFLKKRLSIDWVETAKIEKIDDDRTIRLSFKNNFLALKLNDEKTNANLKIDHERTDEFIARTENGRLNIYDPWYEAHAVECDRGDPSLPGKVAALLASDELVTVAICPGSGDGGDVESQNVLIAMAIENALHMAKNQAKQTQILVYLRRRSGFGSLFGSMGADGRASIHAFGLIETLYNRDTLLHEKQDAVAMALHEDYRKRHGGDKWSKLTEEFRDSNRLAADHIPVKLRAIGLRIANKGEGEPADLTVFKTPEDENAAHDPDLELLAEMEHSRWCAERWLLGWRYGEPKNREEKIRLKINHYLVPWAELDSKEREKDWEQIRAIPAALDMVGKMIVSAKHQE